MKELIQKALDRSGFGFMEPTEESLLQCYHEYLDHGVFGRVSFEDVKNDYENGDITLKQICYNLIKMR